MEENNKLKKKSIKKFFARRNILIIAAAIVAIGGASGTYLVKASENPSFCSTCHIMEPYYQSWQDSSLLANKHASAGVTCHDCHESSISIQAEEGLKFVTGDYKDPLDKREFPTEFCLECHSDSGTGNPKGDSFNTAKAKTNFEESNPHDSHNGEQECNLCHNMHQPSNVMCSQCHIFDWMDELDEGWINL